MHVKGHAESGHRPGAGRALQVDYIAAFPENATDNNLRVSTGLVWRFGTR